MFAGYNRIASMSGCIVLSAAIAGILHGGAALAADAPASSGLQEIIVTAQRVQTDLQKTPVSITQFSGEVLQERGINSMLEVGTFTPNLQVGSRGGAAGTAGGYAIRGMGVDSPVSSPAVGLYVDDVYFPSSTGNLLGLFDVARVEVLRGPQGTLFGRNTIAGAVQYISVKPSTEGVSGFVEGTGGNFNRADFSGALNAPLSDTVAVRISAGSRERDGFVHDDLNNVDRGSDDTKQGRLQVRWTPTDNLSIDVKGEILKQKGNGRAFSVVGVSPNSTLVRIATGQFPFPLPYIFETQPYNSSLVSDSNYQLDGLNDPDFFKFEYEAAQGTIAYNFTDNLTLTSISAYSESATDNSTDIDGVPLSIISTTNGNQTRLFTEELRLSGRSFGDRFNWTTGFYYYNEVRHTDIGTFKIAKGSSIPGQLGQPDRGGAISDLTSEAYAVYAQGTYDLTDRLSGTLGVRYSSEQVDFEEFPPYLNQVPTAFPLTSSDTFTDTSPYVGMNFQANPDLMIYAKASKGFRAGGTQVVSLFPRPANVLTPFEQETAWTYELGTRMEFMDRRLRINPTLFYTDWTEVQFNALSPIGIPFTYNAGDAEIKGGELEMQFAATDRWLLDASVAYLDGKYTRIDPVILAAGLLSLDDDMQQSPKNKYTAGVRYALPISNGGRIVTNVNYAWVDRFAVPSCETLLRRCRPIVS